MSYNFQNTNLIKVDSPDVKYTESHITTNYTYTETSVKTNQADGSLLCVPKTQKYQIKTKTTVPKVGVMFVGWGGNNGSTVTAGIIANKKGLSWRTPRGTQKANYFGSLTQASTVRLGLDEEGSDVYVPFSSVLPMARPDDLVIGGWDISDMHLGDAMRRSAVLPILLQDQVMEEMSTFQPLPSVYFPDFIAANQSTRANNVLKGSKQEQLDKVRQDIREFKAAKGVETVIVLWTANTERFCEIREGLNDTADALLASVKRGEEEVSPSTVFAIAAALEGCSYINGSPQNTFVPGAVELAQRCKTFIGGDDFKSGQTKMKSVLVDFLVSAGIKPVSIVSYNHLGNNDGKNLSAPRQFRSKEISKSNVVDDMVASNGIMFDEGEHPDHCVVIKYVPYVGDSKRALDEYTSEIFCGGINTISMHNTCEDSLLAAPLIIDLILLTELLERITIRKNDSEEFEGFHSILSLLSFLIKAPLVPQNTPVINALFSQRQAIVNTMRACIGLQPDHSMHLQHRLQTAGMQAAEANKAALDSVFA